MEGEGKGCKNARRRVGKSDEWGHRGSGGTERTAGEVNISSVFFPPSLRLVGEANRGDSFCQPLEMEPYTS